MPQIAQLAATYSSQIFWLLVTFALGLLVFLALLSVAMLAAPAPASAQGVVKSAVRTSAEQVMAQLQRVLNRQVPGMSAAMAPAMNAPTQPMPADPRGDRAGPATLTGRLHAAINHAQEMLRHRAQPAASARPSATHARNAVRSQRSSSSE
mgnify:CR=1 FL=1